MNMLIVEDELIEQQALTKILRRLYPGTTLVLAYAVDGVQAVKTAKTFKPEIILLDIQLPLCDGLEVARKIRLFDEEVEIVMITAYSKFEYAQQAVKNNTYDYIIKPYSIKTIKTLMEGLFDRVESKRQKARKLEENGKLKVALQQEFLQKLYLGALLSKQNIQDYVGLLGLEHTHFVLGMFVRKQGDGALFFHYIEELERTYEVWHIHSEFQTLHLVLFLNSQEAHLRKYMTVLGQKRLDGTFVSGAPTGAWYQLPSLYKDLLTSVSQALPQEISSEGISQGMAQAVLAKDESSFLDLAHTLPSIPAFQTMPELVLRRNLLVICMRIIQQIYSVGDVQASSLYQEVGYPILQEEQGTLQQAWHEFFTFLKFLYSFVQENIATRNERLLSQVKHRINESYAQSLSLEVLASEVSLSPSYLSRIFKTIEGVNLKDYILHVRLDKAKQGLFLGKTVEEVSSESGFSDPAYFTKCFKRVTGRTPREFLQEKRGE
ncbi:response regulator transcription factor [Sphaerochaeta sp.]|uniref:response regulator transcription factor n=1 Tax=Sphaerochaeta sp. TaxID=1972642 RepID=UPI002FCBF0C8